MFDAHDVETRESWETRRVHANCLVGEFAHRWVDYSHTSLIDELQRTPNITMTVLSRHISTNIEMKITIMHLSVRIYESQNISCQSKSVNMKLLSAKLNYCRNMVMRRHIVYCMFLWVTPATKSTNFGSRYLGEGRHKRTKFSRLLQRADIHNNPDWWPFSEISAAKFSRFCCRRDPQKHTVNDMSPHYHVATII